MTTTKPKYKIGDTVYYMAVGKLKPVTITSQNPVSDARDTFLYWNYNIKGHKVPCYMDGVNAPIGICVDEEQLYKNAEEIYEYAQRIIG